MVQPNKMYHRLCSLNHLRKYANIGYYNLQLIFYFVRINTKSGFHTDTGLISDKWYKSPLTYLKQCK